jgi:hypothetical protein
MPKLGPIKRTALIFYLRRLGFVGPRPGRKHEIMQRGEVTIRVPNPHRGDISVGFLAELLRQAGISRDEWERL